MTFKESFWNKLCGKHAFVMVTIIGATLVGSINATFRIWGFFLCVIGNIFWIWYHRKITKDMEMMWIFTAYLIINSMAIINNYFNGVTIF